MLGRYLKLVGSCFATSDSGSPLCLLKMESDAPVMSLAFHQRTDPSPGMQDNAEESGPMMHTRMQGCMADT